MYTIPSKFCLRRRLPVILVAVVCISPEAKSLKAADLSIETIKSAWQERQKSLSTLLLNWDETVFYRRGSSNGAFDTGIAPDPPEDTVVHFKRSLLYDRGRVRIVDIGKYRADAGAFFDSKNITVWNGKESRFLGDFEKRFDVGFIAQSRADAFQDAQFKPPLIACWPLEVANGIRLEGYRITKTASQDGAEIVVLEKRNRAGPDGEIWLQSTPPFVIVRSVRYDRAVRNAQIEIKYGTDPQHGAYPIEWKVLHFDAVGYSKTAEAKVTAHDFSPRIADGDFTIDFTPGTWVHDKAPSGETKQYILRKDGTRREIFDHELRRGATHRHLMGTEPGRAYPGKEGASVSPYRWIMLVASVGLAFAAAIYIRAKLYSRIR